MSHETDADVVRVYCAGPLFNKAERTEMSAIADVLGEAGYRCISRTATGWNSG
jgi:hypothetical protein